MNAAGELQLTCSPPLFKEDTTQRWRHYILDPSPNLLPDTERVWGILAPAEQYYSHIIAQIFCAWVNLKGDPTKISPQSPLSPAVSKYRRGISVGGTKYTGVATKPERIMGMMCWTHATGGDLNFYGLTAQYHTLWLMSSETEEWEKCRKNSKSLLAGRLDQTTVWWDVLLQRCCDTAILQYSIHCEKIIYNIMRLKLKKEKIPSWKMHAP